MHLLESIIDGVNAVIYAKDLAGCYILVNREYEARFHVKKAGIIGKTDYEMFPTEQAELLRAHDEEVLQTRSPIEWEEIVSVNGGLCNYVSLKFPLYDSAGKPYAVASISTDITTRKQKTEALRQSEELFRMLVESVRDAGLLTLDPTGRVVSWNAGAERITGYRADEIVGRYVSDLGGPEEATTERSEQELRASADQGIAEREGWRARKDDSPYWAHTTTTALRDKNSDLLGFARVMREAPDRQSQNEASAFITSGPTAKVEQPIVAESPAMREVLRFARRVAESEATTILLEGESGTGKDLVAQMIHHQSRRRAEPFIAINCAAIPETLLESELFGYEKGAFTDARTQKRGVLELAHRGTLFLDEVAELPHVLQTKLLRVLEEQSFRHLGGLKEIQLDLRVVAATNKNLREAVETGAFRQDLYFRVNVIAIAIPALRDRPGDILPLANFFVKHFNRRFKRQLEGISPRAAELLLLHNWPGNVRELRNAIERAMILEDSRFVTLGSLPPLGTTSVAMAEVPVQNAVASGEVTPLKENEKNLVLEAIRKTHGNQTQAAKLLGISRDAMRYKLKKFGPG